MGFKTCSAFNHEYRVSSPNTDTMVAVLRYMYSMFLCCLGSYIMIHALCGAAQRCPRWGGPPPCRHGRGNTCVVHFLHFPGHQHPPCMVLYSRPRYAMWSLVTRQSSCARRRAKGFLFLSPQGPVAHAGTRMF